MNLKMLLAVSALILVTPVLGHEVTNGPHGGRVAKAGDYHVELVANQNVVEVYLTDGKEKPVAPAGFKGVAILVVSGKSMRITLDPAGDSKLSGKAPNAIASEPPGVVQITAPDGKTAQARFH